MVIRLDFLFPCMRAQSILPTSLSHLVVDDFQGVHLLPFPLVGRGRDDLSGDLLRVDVVYNGHHSRQSLPSCGTTRHLCSQGRAFTPFKHVRAPLLGQILPRQVVNFVQNELVLPLFHVRRF